MFTVGGGNLDDFQFFFRIFISAKFSTLKEYILEWTPTTRVVIKVI